MRDKPVERVMTVPPVVVAPGASIAAARQLMAGKTIHHLPVVDGERLVGILGATDLAHAPADATVADVMQPQPISIDTRASLRDAAAILAAGMFHSLPVTAADGSVVGVVTSSDLIKLLLEQLPREREGHDTPATAVGHFSEEENLAGALQAAERRHRAGDDPERLAAVLLYLNAKVGVLEAALRAADHYLHSGSGEHEHAVLVRAVSRAKETVRPKLQIGRL